MVEEKYYKEEYKTARKIIKTRTLHSDLVERDGKFLSIRFYYVYQGERYNLWVDKNLETGDWEYNQYIFNLSNSNDVMVEILQKLINTETLDYRIDCIVDSL